MKQILLLLVLVAFTSVNGSAQTTVDITLVHTANNMLDVRVRPNAYFDGVFSSLVFTLRWESGSTIALAPAMAPDDAPIVIGRSGPVHTDGAYRYQVFAGFSLSSLSGNGQHWDADTEYTLVSIPFTGSGAVELVNDAWTDEHNGDYYVSLNGVDRTGVIYSEMSTTVGEEVSTTTPALIAWPNPATEVINFTLLDSELEGGVEVIDATGRVVRTERLSTIVGRMDITGLATGRYTLRTVSHRGARSFVFVRM